ncbi:hypothetical protein [Streptomyces sp. G45]|uniref:hypothetical protein n=1 Tax=Streptomyces sp. G45 TaxID=3406627 RepID=UPI003C1706FE
MADVKIDELLDDVQVTLPSAAEVRARGGRRRARRRAAGVAAAVAVVAAGAVTWVALPDDAGRDARPATRPGPTLVVEGMPRMLPPDQLPDDARRDWRTEEAGVKDFPLPRIADRSTCPDAYRSRKTPRHIQYLDRYYATKGDHADATHRVVEYANPAVAARELEVYQGELAACGLHFTAGDKPYYSGAAKGDGSRLHVTVERDGKWVSVVEVQVEGIGG